MNEILDSGNVIAIDHHSLARAALPGNLIGCRTTEIAPNPLHMLATRSGRSGVPPSNITLT